MLNILINIGRNSEVSPETDHHRCCGSSRNLQESSISLELTCHCLFYLNALVGLPFYQYHIRLCSVIQTLKHWNKFQGDRISHGE